MSVLPTHSTRPRGRSRRGRALLPVVALVGFCAITPACSRDGAAPSPTSPASVTMAVPTSPTGSATDPTSIRSAGSVTGEGSATPTSAAASGSTDTTGAPGSATTAVVPLPTDFVTVGAAVRDPELGHEIAVTRIARSLAWPPGHRGQELAFELVGVEMRWTTGAAYTAPLRAGDFSIATTAAFPNRPERMLDPTFVAAGWPVLPEVVPNGQSVTGWMVFLVDPKGASSLRLDYTRPAMRVTNAGGVTFPKKVFSIQLVAPPTDAPPAPSSAPPATP